MPDGFDTLDDVDAPPLFGTWLQQTRVLQTVSFGQDPAELEGEAKADFITWNFAALVIELGEMMAEYPSWKPWVVERGQTLNREQFIAEMVDALHFVGNILAAVGCDDREFTAAYTLKMSKNAARMAAGNYDGVSNKCPVCHRELIDIVENKDQPAMKLCPEHGVI